MNGPEFIHQSNPKFHLAPEVEYTVDYLRAHGTNISNEPAHKIGSYIAFLADKSYVNDGFLTGDKASIERQIDYHAIKPHQVPNSHFEREGRIAQERGLGYIDYSEDQRKEMATVISNDHRASIGRWATYLSGEHTHYDNWFKLYAAQAVLKLSSYDKEKALFGRRSSDTVAPVPELNPEALATVYTRAKTGAKGLSFAKMYAKAFEQALPASPEQKTITKGKWRRFKGIADYEEDSGEVPEVLYSHPTVRALTRSLQGQATGWCTAGEAEAANQLYEGDFYIYYSQDKAGNNTIPRLAIRMNYDSVVEVRGIDLGQQVEPVMLATLHRKLKHLPNGFEYLDKIADMQRLTVLHDQVLKDPHCDLSANDLRFVYQIDSLVVGFSLDEEPDPRTETIRMLRRPVIARDAQVMFGLDANRSLVEQLLVEDIADDIVYNTFDEPQTEEHKRQEWLMGNLDAIVQVDSESGLCQLSEFLAENDYKYLLEKRSLFAERGIASEDEIIRRVFYGQPKNRLNEAILDEVFCKPGSLLTVQQLEYIICNVSHEDAYGNRRSIFSSGMGELILDSVNMSSPESVTSLLRLSLTGSHPDRDFVTSICSRVVAGELPLPRPSSAVVRVLKDKDKRALMRRWGRVEGDNLLADTGTAIRLLMLDSARDEDIDQLFEGHSRDEFEIYDHNKLAHYLLDRNPEALKRIVENLKHLDGQTYRKMCDHDLHYEALKYLNNFDHTGVDPNKIIANAVAHDIDNAELIVDAVNHSRVESLLDAAVVDMIALTSNARPNLLLTQSEKFTPAAHQRIVSYMYHGAPLSLLTVIDQNKPENRQRNKYNRLDPNDLILPIIDESKLLATMLSNPLHARQAIVRRKQFNAGMFVDRAVAEQLMAASDSETLEWAQANGFLASR